MIQRSAERIDTFLSFVVKDMDLHCAMELTVYVDYGSRNLSRHYAHPTDKADVLRGSPGECGYIGKCYSASWGLRADTFCKAHYNSEKGLAQPESFWVAFENMLREDAAECAKARLEDGDLKWVVCPCCKGERVVLRSEP